MKRKRARTRIFRELALFSSKISLIPKNYWWSCEGESAWKDICKVSPQARTYFCNVSVPNLLQWLCIFPSAPPNFSLRRVHLHGKGPGYVFSRDMIYPKMQHGFAMALVEKGGRKITWMLLWKKSLRSENALAAYTICIMPAFPVALREFPPVGVG